MEFCVSILNCYETEMLDMTTPRPWGTRMSWNSQGRHLIPYKSHVNGWIRGSKHQIVNHQPGTLGSPLSMVPLKTSPQRLAPKSGESFTFRGFL